MQPWPPVVNSDILLECAPSELVQTFDIATDKAWSPALQYLDGEQDVFYVRPFQTAYEDVERVLLLLDGFKTQITDFFFIYPCPAVNILYLSMQTLIT